jgi:hypothetical protein
MSKPILVLAILGLAALVGLAFIIFHPSYSGPENNSTPPAASDAAPQVNSSAWVTSSVEVPIPGLPPFSISYPSYFGDPVITEEVDDAQSVDAQNNDGTLIFYKPNSPHTFPNAGSEVYLLVDVSVSTMLPNQSLQSFADAQIIPTDTEKVQYDLTIAGSPAIAQKPFPAAPQTSYYVGIGNGLVAKFTLTQHVTDGDDRPMNDKIVESVNFKSS